MPIKEKSLHGWYEVTDMNLFIFNPRSDYSNLRRLTNMQADTLERKISEEGLNVEQVKSTRYYHPPNKKTLKKKKENARHV